MENSILINQLKTLLEKYNENIKKIGEHFNIFSILKVDSNEVRTHSAFIRELLNPKGSHGFKGIFLNLFLNEIKESLFTRIEKNHISENFDLDCNISKVIIEENIGQLNEEKTIGGRIDLVIKEGKKTIVIENKIYAYEQTNQLIRYKNAYPNAPILYLTLFGEDATSQGKLVRDKDYFLISYESHILNWLEKCIDVVENDNMLRLIISQYLFLIKKLTSKSSLDNLHREVVNIMSKNVEEVFTIYNNNNPCCKITDNEVLRLFDSNIIYKLKDKLFNEFMDVIENKCKKQNILFRKVWEWNIDADYGFYIKPENCQEIRFLFQFGNFEGFYFGIELNDKNREIEKEGFTNQDGKFLWKYWGRNPNSFGNNTQKWQDISLKENGNTFKRVFEIVEELKDI